MVNDPVGDFIIRIKNASAVGKEGFVAPYSKLRFAVAEMLQKHGYLKSVDRKGKKIQKTIEVALRYNKDKTPYIHGVERVSKPGRRVYCQVNKIHPVKYGKGLLVLSTPKGILAGKEAKKEKVGGEILFKIW